MSVIPLVRDDTIVDSMDSFDRDGDRILIVNLDPDQLRPDNRESNVSYDLRVGDEYRDHRDQGKRDTGDIGEIVLYPQSAVIIQTLEHVYPPRSRFAYIVPKVSLLQKGISNTSSKVDPGYPGPLLITVFNLGKTIVKLRRGEKFCTIVFHDVAYPEDTRPYDKEHKRILGAGTMSKWQKLRDFVDRNSGTISAIAFVFTLIIMALEAALLHYLATHH
jgi:deoxycytidine triphosphate deaminase